MNKILYGILLYLLFGVKLYAQTTTITIKILGEETHEPLIGATVHFENLEIGAITNDEGWVVLEKVPRGEQNLTISYVGFKTIADTFDILEQMPIKIYYMKDEGLKLEDITVKATRSTRTIKKIPTRIEFIGPEELNEKIMMNSTNIAMVLRESTGIQMQQTSLSSANNSIRIQGLDGRYTQLLKDGFPLYGGFSGGLSIMQIPPLDLNQFEIIKGSSSTLYGGGAIAGLVNMVSKTPNEKPKLDIMLSPTHVGGSTANVFYSKRKNKFGYTLYSSGHYQKIYDPDDDDFSNLPETRTLSFNPKLFYYPSKTATFWLGVNGTYDQREGGDLIAIKDGANVMHQYKELNNSTRISTQSVYEKEFNNGNSLQVKNSVSYFDRELTTPSSVFSGTQWDVFSEVNYAIQKEKSDWILGGNFYSNSFKERDHPIPRTQSDITIGIFANNTTDLSDKFILETGLRTDYSPDWGLFPLPRVSLLWKSNNNFSSRLGGGLGYKIPDIFIEEAATLNFENVFPIDKDRLKAEYSYGGNIDFNYKGRIFDKIYFSINQLFYLTSIDRALLLNKFSISQFFSPTSMDRDLLLDDYPIYETYHFENADGTVLSRGAETNIKFTYNDFIWFLNYSYIKTTLNYLPDNPQKTLTPLHMAGSVLMYENDKWRIGYETYYTGSQGLSSGAKTPNFFTMGLLVQKHFIWGSLYANFENFTDRRQSRFSPEILPPHQDPKFAEIYAPTDGFIFSIGVLINPFGRENEH